MADSIERVSNSSKMNTKQQEHPLSKMPPFGEHIKHPEASSTQSGVSGNSLPKIPAAESVLHEDGSEVHLKPTDLSLKSQERPPILMTDEYFSPEPEQFADFKLTVLKRKVKDLVFSTSESRVNRQISIDNPDLFEKISDVKDSLHYDPDEEMPSEDEIQAILANALPLLKQYKTVYEQTKQRIDDDSRNNHIRKSEERKIYNLLHKDENDRLKKRRSLYTAYDLSKSKSIPDEYKGLSFEEVKQIEEEKKKATKRNERGIFRLEETSETSQAEAKAKEEQTESFYADLNMPEDEPRFMEAVEIYDNMDWHSFPHTINMKPVEEASKSTEETRQIVKSLQSFAKKAEDNPRDGSILRDDRLVLGDEYNKLITSVKKVNNRLNYMGRELSGTQIKGFCHDLALIANEYKEKQRFWQIEGERSLSDAFDAYADIYGVEAVKDDLGEEIPNRIDKYTVWPLVTKINDTVRRDWQHKITPIESYEEGSEYSFICSRVIEPFSAQERRRSIFSCSLLTNSHHETINDSGSFGFILPPDHIIAAASHDIGTYNGSNEDVASASFGVPVIMSYDRVLRESQENKTYSEITTRDLPIGIFYLKDKIDEKGRKKLAELIRINPKMPVIAL